MSNETTTWVHFHFHSSEVNRLFRKFSRNFLDRTRNSLDIFVILLFKIEASLAEYFYFLHMMSYVIY